MNQATRSRPAGTTLAPYENLSDSPDRTALSRAVAQLREGWSHRGKYPALSFDAPIPWFNNDTSQRSWMFLRHSWDMLNHLLHAHSLGGQRHFLEVSLRIALDWISHHPDRTTEVDNSFAWYDMAVGMRAYRLAYLIDALEHDDESVSDTVLALLWKSLEVHCDYLEIESNIIFHNNHGFYQAAGQLAIGRRFRRRSPKMETAYRLGNQRLLRMIHTQFSDEGVHKEHSPDYHRMVYDTLKAIIAAGLVNDPEIEALCIRIEKSLAWFVMPNGRLVNFGDSDSRLVTGKSKDVVRKWRTAEMRYMASGGRLGSHPGDTHAVFSESGYFIARDRWPEGPADFGDCSYLAQAAAFHSRTHKHADDLTFVWTDRGHEIIVDSGRYGYLGKTQSGSDLWKQGHWYADPARIYCESTRAHNVVEIDGLDYPRKGARPYGSAIVRAGKSQAGVYFCETEFRPFRTIRLARVLLFLPGRWLLVLDWVLDNTGEPHDFRQLFHLHPGLSVTPNEAGFVCAVPSSRTPLRVASLTGAEPMQPEIGNSGARMQGFYSPKERTLLPNYVIGFMARSVPQVAMATLFTFSERLGVAEGKSVVAGSGRSGVLKWSDERGRHELRFARPLEGDFEVHYATAVP